MPFWEKFFLESHKMRKSLETVPDTYFDHIFVSFSPIIFLYIEYILVLIVEKCQKLNYPLFWPYFLAKINILTACPWDMFMKMSKKIRNKLAHHHFLLSVCEGKTSLQSIDSNLKKKIIFFYIAVLISTDCPTMGGLYILNWIFTAISWEFWIK